MAATRPTPSSWPATRAFTLVDSTHFGEFSDPKRSKIVGKIGMAPFPVGPRAKVPTSWNEIWGWAIPIGVPAEKKKLVKEMLSAMMSDEAGQIEMWKKTGGPPPNIKLWPKIARARTRTSPRLKHAVFDQKPITHSAYYFAEWPAVHKAYSDAVISRDVRQARGHRQGAAGQRREDPARRPWHQLRL